MFLKSTNEIIGTCGFDFFDRNGKKELELGYRLKLSFWGKGFATEAATALLHYSKTKLNQKVAYAFVLPQNNASVQTLKRLQFQYLEPMIHANISHDLYQRPLT